MAHAMLLLIVMNSRFFNWKDMTILDGAIAAGLVAVFLAVAVPLIHGAILRQRTAECARKIMQAAEALDECAASSDSPPAADAAVRNVFSSFKWWEKRTELGGQWDWYSNGQGSCAVVICGPRISSGRMIRLDVLLDDGNLETGFFQRRTGGYHYIVRNHVL